MSASAPVGAPASAANNTPAIIDPDLRTSINAILIKDGHITRIHEHLLHALHAHPTDWPAAIQGHALSLLRSGEVTNFGQLLRRVLEDVRQDTMSGGRGGVGGGVGAGFGGGIASGGSGSGGGSEEGGDGDDQAQQPQAQQQAQQQQAQQHLALPQAVVDEAIRVTRDSLETFVYMREG